MAVAGSPARREGEKEQSTRRVARLLDLVWRVAYHPHRWDRARLAALYEVSERTITKDLCLLRHGLGLAILPGDGGYYFPDAPHLLVRPPVQYDKTARLPRDSRGVPPDPAGGRRADAQDTAWVCTG